MSQFIRFALTIKNILKDLQQYYNLVADQKEINLVLYMTCNLIYLHGFNFTKQIKLVIFFPFH